MQNHFEVDVIVMIEFQQSRHPPMDLRDRVAAQKQLEVSLYHRE